MPIKRKREKRSQPSEAIPTPQSQDMWIMLLSTVRYSMGRRTYMSSVAPELVIKYRYYLQLSRVKQIRDEVQKELELHYRMKGEGREKWLGDDCDVHSWEIFIEVVNDIIADTEAGKNTGVMRDYE